MKEDKRMSFIKTHKRWGFAAIIVMLTLSMGACGMHQGRHDMDQVKVMKRITKKLDLNELQQGQLQVVLENASSFRQGLQDDHKNLTKSLKASLNESQLDVDALNQQFDAMEVEFSSFRKSMVSDYADFHASLDDTQREKLVVLIEKVGHHRRH